jgi:hypothetical protein
MLTEEMHVALCRVVHDLWRKRLKEEGWKRGTFDPLKKQHDALVPYDQLSRGDQVAISVHIRAEEFEDRITSGLTLPRGPNRPLLIEEMRVGLPVAYVRTDRLPSPSQLQPKQMGSVVSWEREPDGELGLVTVRWGDGSVEECDPWSGELIRMDELK